MYLVCIFCVCACSVTQMYMCLYMYMYGKCCNLLLPDGISLMVLWCFEFQSQFLPGRPPLHQFEVCRDITISMALAKN